MKYAYSENLKIAKNVFQKLYKVLRNRKNSFENKENSAVKNTNCDIMCNPNMVADAEKTLCR